MIDFEDSNNDEKWNDKLIKNPFILNTLLTLYRDVMTPIKVVTKISDVQCNKNIHYEKAGNNKYKKISGKNEYNGEKDTIHWQSRKLYDFFVSNDGKRLLYAYKGDDTKKYEGSFKDDEKHLFTFDYMNHIYGPNDTPKTMAIKLNKDIYNLMQSD